MTTEAQVNAALPAMEHVVDHKVKLDVDAAGEPAVWIWIIVSDDWKPTPDQAADLRTSIRSALRKASIELWPYIRFRTETEQRELDREPA